MATGLAYYRGGPKDGQLQFADSTAEYLMFQIGTPPWPRYKLTTETIEKNGKTYPVAQFVEPTKD